MRIKLLLGEYVLHVAVVLFNPFVSNASFLYPLQTSENLTFFWCFQGVEKGRIGKKQVNNNSLKKDDRLILTIVLSQSIQDI